MPPNVFINHAAGDILPAADWSSNWSLVEASFDVIGPFIQTGLIPTAGTGLAVNVSSGNALIDANVVKSGSWSITALADNTVNHLFMLQNGTGASNTTGTAPAASVKLGTATTSGGVVTSVNTLRSSGRQVFVRPENQVPGAVGSPGSINLASWAAAAADNVPVFGILPAGAVPSIAVPLTLTLDDANQNTVQTPLILRHSYNAGGGANGIGTALSFSAETATDGVFNTAIQLRALFTDATAATATGRLDVLALDSNVPATPLTVASRSVSIPQTTAATGQHGLLNIGGGGFAGGAGNFSGESPGTLLAMNAVSGYAGGFFNVQLNGVPKFWLDNLSELFHLGAPVTSANAGHVSLGPDFAHFDGSTAGKFTGSASGTYLAINAQSGYSGNLIDAQVHGVGKFSVTGTGFLTAADAASFTLTDAGTSSEPALLTLAHRSSGTPAGSFGGGILVRADNAANALTDQLVINTGWSAAVAGAEGSLASFFIRLAGVDTEVMRLNANGNGQLRAVKDFQHAGASLGFYNTTPIAQPGNTTDLKTVLTSLGLLAAGGATPLNLGGGALTTGSIANAGTYAGSAAPPQLKRAAITFPSDADYTLLSSEYDAFWLDIQTGVITVTRNVIVPVQAGMFYVVRNNNTHDVVIKTSGGTGITVAAGRARIVMSGSGTNLSALTPSQDFTL